MEKEISIIAKTVERITVSNVRMEKTLLNLQKSQHDKNDELNDIRSDITVLKREISESVELEKTRS